MIKNTQKRKNEFAKDENQKLYEENDSSTDYNFRARKVLIISERILKHFVVLSDLFDQKSELIISGKYNSNLYQLYNSSNTDWLFNTIKNYHSS
jgi:hypothetical protein